MMGFTGRSTVGYGDGSWNPGILCSFRENEVQYYYIQAVIWLI
jgi:hypothetical protein